MNSPTSQKARSKSDGKIAQHQNKKLLKLNFNLEQQVIDQTIKIQKQNKELNSALEYVNGLEEELLNLKINSLYSQSALCSPRNEELNHEGLLEQRLSAIHSPKEISQSIILPYSTNPLSVNPS